MKPKFQLNVIKLLLPAAVILIFFCSNAYSQRCGDGILFNITDNSGSFLDSNQMEIGGYLYDSYFYDSDSEIKRGYKFKYPVFYKDKPDTVFITKIKNHIEWYDKQHLYLRTYCSMLLMKVKITYNTKVMELDIYNIPGDVAFKTDNIIFAEGRYELNLNGYAEFKEFPEGADGNYIIMFKMFKNIK